MILSASMIVGGFLMMLSRAKPQVIEAFPAAQVLRTVYVPILDEDTEKMQQRLRLVK